MKILVVAHVLYPQLWPELADCIRNITERKDVVITFVDEASVVEARRDFPDARFVLCENRGYDVWPFIRALRATDPSSYDVIVKLHTKRDVEETRGYHFNHVRFYGSAWRNHLLAFVRTPEAWMRTLRKLSRPGVGMVADRHVVMRRNDVRWERTRASFDAAAGFLGIDPEAVRRRGQYVAGSMFAARPAALLPLLEKPLEAKMFDPSEGHLTETFAHVVERAFGLSVGLAGLRITAFNGSLGFRRALFPFRRILGI